MNNNMPEFAWIGWKSIKELTEGLFTIKKKKPEELRKIQEKIELYRELKKTKETP